MIMEHGEGMEHSGHEHMGHDMPMPSEGSRCSVSPSPFHQ